MIIETIWHIYYILNVFSVLKWFQIELLFRKTTTTFSLFLVKSTNLQTRVTLKLYTHILKKSVKLWVLIYYIDFI